MKTGAAGPRFGAGVAMFDAKLDAHFRPLRSPRKTRGG